MSARSAVSTRPLPRDVDLLGWLEAVEGSPKFYWLARDGAVEAAGAGLARSWRADGAGDFARPLADAAAFVADEPGALAWFGGRVFPSETPGTPWEGTPPSLAVCPARAIVRDDKGVRYVTMDDAPTEDPRGLPLLSGRRAARGRTPAVSATESPGRDDFSASIARGAAAVSRGRLGKVVLASRTDLVCETAPDPFALLRALRDLGQPCYHFLVQPAPDAYFLGATPERLFRSEEGVVTADALGGTCGRPADPREEERVVTELLADPKNRREHDFIRDDVRRKLAPLASGGVTLEGPEALRLSKLVHLHSSARAFLLPGVRPGDLLTALSPTAAVCGTPHTAAVEFIRREETSARGWYAGPVGVVTGGSAELAVALRSILVRGATASVFGGAGVVAGSSPASEYDEVARKKATALSLFGLPP